MSGTGTASTGSPSTRQSSFEQIFAEIQSRTDERFELLDSVSYQELYNREESLAATVGELKSQLSEAASAFSNKSAAAQKENT